MISVIMPVYNSEKYLVNAIESVLSQTYKDFELILVNDGSKDGSRDICEKYAKIDKRVKVINKENGGICSARNAGLKIATGDYIAFIDNDDLYTNRLLEDNYRLAIDNNADLVRFGVKYLNTENDLDSGTLFNDEKKLTPAIYETENVINNYYSFRQKNLRHIWSGIYKKELIDKFNLCFNELYKFGFEDWMFNVQFFFCARKIVVNPEKYYIHFGRIDYSTSMKYNFNRVESFIDGSKRELALCNEREIDEIQIAKMLSFYITMILRELWGKDKELSYKEKKNIINSLGYENYLKYYKKFKIDFLCNDKKNSILSYLYLHKNFMLQKLVVNVWKLSCLMRKKYF